MKKKLAQGPLGFPMPDELARNLEALLKSLPKDKAYSYRKAQTLPTAVELVDGERADVSTISTDSIDREHEVVIPKGMNLTYFTKNPVVTFAHKYDELPVGRAAWVKMVGDVLKAKTIYANKPDGWAGPWLPDAVFSMTQQGIIRGKSVGFLPTKVRSPTREELSLKPEWKNAHAVIESSLLLEYAIAPIPVNQDALVEAVSKGVADLAILKRLGLSAPATEAPTRPKRGRPATKAVSSVADLEAVLKALERMSFDPARIAEDVYRGLKNRGKV
jgi:hypothetical protein